MPVYTLPHDQAQSRYPVRARNPVLAYRPTSNDLPALSATGSGRGDDEGSVSKRKHNLNPSAEIWARFLCPRPTKLQRFLDLPKEIRELIWVHSLRDEPHWVRGNEQRHFTDTVELRGYNTSNNSMFPFLPAICRLSRTTREEAIHVYLRGSIFMVSSYKINQYLSAFLHAIDGHRSVRGLHFEYFDFFNSGRYATATTNADLELSVRCTGLKHIKLRMHNRRLDRPINPYDDVYVSVPVQDIWDKYMLDRLIACQSVVKVTILRKGWDTEAGDETAAELVSRIEEEFRAVGRSVMAEAIRG